MYGVEFLEGTSHSLIVGIIQVEIRTIDPKTYDMVSKRYKIGIGPEGISMGQYINQ